MNEASILFPSLGCAGVVLLIIAVVLALPRWTSVEKSKAGSSYELRELADELTPAEKKAKRAADRQADRDTHNANERSGNFHAGYGDWRDADGVWHKF